MMLTIRLALLINSQIALSRHMGCVCRRGHITLRVTAQTPQHSAEPPVTLSNCTPSIGLCSIPFVVVVGAVSSISQHSVLCKSELSEYKPPAFTYLPVLLVFRRMAFRRTIQRLARHDVSPNLTKVFRLLSCTHWRYFFLLTIRSVLRSCGRSTTP